jgi:Tol biopolymer transport system component
MKTALASAFIVILSVITNAANPAPVWMRYPAISPDGKTIVFESKGDLWRVDSSGGTAVALTSNDAHDYLPVWSHDGKTIAFASDRNGNFDVFTMQSDGGEPTRLTFHSAGE